MSNPQGAAGPFSQWERAIAGRYLRAKRKDGGVALIAIIAFVGITLAVIALIVVMSVMNGFRSELLDRMLGFNGHAVVFGDVFSQPVDPETRAAAVARIRKVPGVVQAVPMVETQALALGRDRPMGIMVRGISPADLRGTPILANNIKEGSLSGYGDGDDGGDLILVGQGLAAQLGVHAGDSIELVSPNGAATAFGETPQSKVFIVAGLFQVGMSQYDEYYVYMPLEQAKLFFGRGDTVDKVEVLIKNPDAATGMKAALAKAAGPGGVAHDWTEENANFFNALQVERNVMRLILMILVVIAAMNIISGLIMLVKNKGRDIAILRTMGASQGAILRIFFMAGASVGVLGTAFGMLLGTLFCIYIQPIQRFVEHVTGREVFNADIYFLTHIPAKIDWAEALFVAAWAMAVSFLATLPPAWIASRVDPVEALRYE